MLVEFETLGELRGALRQLPGVWRVPAGGGKRAESETLGVAFGSDAVMICNPNGDTTVPLSVSYAPMSQGVDRASPL
jgi:hypothetical protein